jgi:hypothetical protein
MAVRNVNVAFFVFLRDSVRDLQVALFLDLLSGKRLSRQEIQGDPRIQGDLLHFLKPIVDALAD